MTRRAGWISLWAGQFDSLDDLEDHVDMGDLEKQHGFVIEPPLLPFNAFLDDPTPEKLARTFVKDEAVVKKLVKALGREPANSLLLHEDVVYDASLAPKGKKEMRFVGSWRLMR